MAKYYVESGTLRAVIDSPDRHRAALWAIHRVMQQIAPIDEHRASPAAKSSPHDATGLLVLGDTITLSEIGFDHPEATKVDTFEAFHEWHMLVQALDRLAAFG